MDLLDSELESRLGDGAGGRGVRVERRVSLTRRREMAVRRGESGGRALQVVEKGHREGSVEAKRWQWTGGVD